VRSRVRLQATWLWLFNKKYARTNAHTTQMPHIDNLDTDTDRKAFLDQAWRYIER
jgi:hypothetical protein